MIMKKSKFTVRVEDEILKKFRYVAEYNARSANRKVEVLMRKRITDICLYPATEFVSDFIDSARFEAMMSLR